MLEVCVDRLEAVHQAIDAGAQRIELSENLSVGGVTPSMDLLKATRAELSDAESKSSFRPKASTATMNDFNVVARPAIVSSIK